MAIMVLLRKSLAFAILLLFLVESSCCEARGAAARGAAAPRRTRKRDPNEKVFNVLQFGAKPGGRKDSAMQFVRAWLAACQNKGKSRLLVPAGVFLLGPAVFQGPCAGPVTVQIIGTLKALTDPSAYEEDFWLSFEAVDGLVVTGSGTLDGQGATMWPYKDGSDGSPFPATVRFIRVTNGILRQITSLNPMGFHISIISSHNFRAKNLKVFAPEESPNTDGFHISQSSQVKVSRSIVATGDDCVGIINGCTDVSVKKVTCGPGHGFSIGSLGKNLDEKDVSRITVTNCTLKGTDNGVRIKTVGGSPPSRATDINFSNIIMENVKNPIIIDQLYYRKDQPSRVQITNARYTDIRGTSTSPLGVNIVCSTTHPCQGIQMSNINLKYVGTKREPFASSCCNAKMTYSGAQFPLPCRR